MSVSLFCRGLGLGLGFIAAACTSASETPGTSTEGDSEACTPGALNCVCENYRCESGLVCASGYCVEGGEATGTSEAVTTTSSASTSSSTTGTEPGTTGSTGDATSTTETVRCDEGPAGLSADCPTDAPYCVEGSCVDCSGLAQCAEVDPGAPACDAVSGLCVQCTEADAASCGGATPVCDAAANTCVKCVAHDECPSGACDLNSGACFSEESALWVDSDASCDGDGTQVDPFCEIQDAVKTLSPGAPTLVRVLPRITPYKTKIDVGSDVVAAIVGEGGSPVIDVDLDAILINEGARVYLKQVRFVGSSMSAGNGLVCIGAEVWADQIEVSSRESVAINAIECTLRLRRARVYSNLGGGIKLNGGSTTLENAFVTSNGTAFSLYGGVYTSNMADLAIVYSTFVNNNADANADSIQCEQPGAVSLRNAVLFGQVPATSVACAGIEASDSVVDSMDLADGRNVVIEAAAQSAWFKNAAAGDFHVKAEAPFADVARWRVGDPGVDHDGEARPNVEGEPDWAGADRLP